MTVSGADFSHRLDLAVSGLNEAFISARTTHTQAETLRQQGEMALKQAAKERDFFKAGEIRKEGEYKISESKTMAVRAEREIAKMTVTLTETSGWKEVNHFMDSTSTLNDLVLENCGIDAFVLSVLMKMRGFPGLRKISLAGNDIGDLGAFLLAECLGNIPCAMEEMDMRNCGLSTDGCVRLLQASISNQTLKQIDLRFNGMAESRPLLEAVSGILKLRTLEILI